VPTALAETDTAAVRCCKDNLDEGTVRCESKVPKCERNKTFAEASAICENAGSRLCTRAEVDDNKCCGAGCNLDKRLVWTSTTWSPEESYWTLQGCPKKAHSVTPALLGVSARAYVRCCEGGGLAGAALACSSKPCRGLANYQEALAHCEDQGKRLCTKSEIEQNTCCGAGCGYDKKRVWTSDTNATSMFSHHGRHLASHEVFV